MPEPTGEIESFRRYPFVCGYLGPATERHWADLLAGAPTAVRELTRGTVHALAGSSAPHLEGVRGGWCWGRFIIDRRRPRTWEEAASEMALAGLWHEGESARLHTDLFGLQDVFLRQLGDTVYFANRIAPLRGIGGGRLTQDWDGWGASLAFGGFVGDATPFREIKRLLYGESLTYGPEGLARSRSFPSWLTRPTERGSVDSVADALRSALPSRFARSRRILTLSGGWDSRLLAMSMVAKRARRPLAWTVHPDNGYDDDLRFADPVAAALRLEHHTITPKVSAWVRNRPSTLARVEHLTWFHTWIEPLARRLRRTSRTVLDGLCGDVLLRALFVGDGLMSAQTERARLRVQWTYFGSARLRIPETLAPQVAKHWAESTYDNVTSAGDLWTGHPSEFTLRALTARTCRVTAASPLRLFGPEVTLLLPYMTPAFVREAVSIPVQSKLSSAFYRELLAKVNPAVGPMPSTNDGLPRMPATSARSQASSMALAFMAESIRADDTVSALLHPRLVERLREPLKVGPLRVAPLPVLQWASALADWRRSNAKFLGSDDGPV